MKAEKQQQQSKKTGKEAAGLNQLFEDMLRDIFWAEKALVKALPKMSKNASSQELKDALDEHLTITKKQVERCEQVFEIMGKAARGKKCEAMEGLIEEAEEIMESTEEGVVRDAGIIAAAQKVEHYEIASYGTLCAFAKTLGMTDVKDILGQTLDEEKQADETLTGVAETSINVEAASNTKAEKGKK